MTRLALGVHLAEGPDQRMSFLSFPFPKLGLGPRLSKPSTLDPLPSCQLAARTSLWIQAPTQPPTLTEVEVNGAP